MPINSAPTPLFKKLGLKDGFRAGLIGAPAGYLQLLDLPPHWVIHWCSMDGTFGMDATSGVDGSSGMDGTSGMDGSSGMEGSSDKGAKSGMVAGSMDFVQLFTNEVDVLESLLPEVKGVLRKTGLIWVSWYKRNSGLSSEISDNIVRDTALALGLVDVKVCAINEQWSGLKLVYRLKDRG
jgi:hypothetical protein